MPTPRVLYISYDGMTDALGRSQVLPYLRGLAEAGFEINLLSCEKPGAFEKNRETVSQLCVESNISWHPHRYTKWPPVVSTIKDVRTLRRAAFKLHHANPFEIVHSRSYVPSLVAQKMQQTLGTKFVFDMRGFWADERVDGNIWQLHNPIHSRIFDYFKKREREFLEQADAVISLTNAAKREVQSWNYNFSADKISVIPCCADFEHFNFEHFDSNQRREIRMDLGIAEDAFVMTYHGSIGTWYLLDEMLEFFEMTLQKHTHAHLLFITNDDPELVKNRAARLGINDERLSVTTATREQIPRLLSVTDVSLFFIKPSYSKISSCPTKLAEVLAMGKPLICNFGVGDISEILTDADMGIAIDVNDRDGWQSAVDSIDDLLQLKPSDIREKAKTQFSLQNGIDAYRNIYLDLCEAADSEHEMELVERH